MYHQYRSNIYRQLLVMGFFSFLATTAMAQETQITEDQLRLRITNIIYQKLDSVAAELSYDGTQVLNQIIDDAVRRVFSEQVTEDNIRTTLEASSTLAYELIERGRRPNGRVRFGESTGSYLTSICPLYPFC